MYLTDLPDQILILNLLVYTEFILIRLLRKLLTYINTLESVPGTNHFYLYM